MVFSIMIIMHVEWDLAGECYFGNKEESRSFFTKENGRIEFKIGEVMFSCEKRTV